MAVVKKIETVLSCEYMLRYRYGLRHMPEGLTRWIAPNRLPIIYSDPCVEGGGDNLPFHADCETLELF
jgi:hypothetical protein